jgi:2,3,4,5-tetrahydropyridine-2-carboxylate N-succinyltransferase
MSNNSIHSFGIGIASKNAAGEIIEVLYPKPANEVSGELSAALLEACGLGAGECGFVELDSNQHEQLVSQLPEALATALAGLQVQSTQQALVLCVLGADLAPTSIPEAFLKLQLLSHRLVKPHGVKLDGMFAVLKNLAWTNEGPIDLADLPARRIAARAAGRTLDVASVDKFPKMTDYVVPEGVRIADAARVRLGAYLGAGTTIMHEGFVNFNAGTLGAAMIEGRISAGVVVGENSDLGGGCSTMGTLSGGGKEIISVGRDCLIGANAGIGFPLADGCTVEAGLYVTAGTKVRLLDASGAEIKQVKARELSTLQHHLFRRNSITGAVECVPLKTSVTLNEALHSHN